MAEEVRKLADETNKSANHIQSVVATIQNESIETVNNIKVVQENVSSGIVLSQEATENFNEILNLVEQVTSQIQEVAAATQQLTSGVEVIQHTVHILAAGTKKRLQIQKRLQNHQRNSYIQWRKSPMPQNLYLSWQKSFKPSLIVLNIKQATYVQPHLIRWGLATLLWLFLQTELTDFF